MSRFSLLSRARYTSPMPPAPRGATISYGPSLSPGESAMGLIQFSVLNYEWLSQDRDASVELVDLASVFALAVMLTSVRPLGGKWASRTVVPKRIMQPAAGEPAAIFAPPPTSDPYRRGSPAGARRACPLGRLRRKESETPLRVRWAIVAATR